MENPVTLSVDGFVKRDVDNVSYSFSQTTDKEGQTTSIPRGGLIKIKVKAMNDGNCELLNWMLDRSLAKGGKITYMDTTNQTKKMKDVTFKDGYCVEYVEHWEDPDEAKQPQGRFLPVTHYEQITISCKEITNQSVTYKNVWA